MTSVVCRPHDLVCEEGQEYHGLLRGDAGLEAPCGGRSHSSQCRGSIHVSPVACSRSFGLDSGGREENSLVGAEICSATSGLLRTIKDDLQVEDPWEAPCVLPRLGGSSEDSARKAQPYRVVVPCTSPAMTRLPSINVPSNSIPRCAPCRRRRRRDFITTRDAPASDILTDRARSTECKEGEASRYVVIHHRTRERVLATLLGSLAVVPVSPIRAMRLERTD